MYFLRVPPAASLLLAAIPAGTTLLISSSCRSLSTCSCRSRASFFQPSSRLLSLEANVSAYCRALTPEGLIFTSTTARATLAWERTHCLRHRPGNTEHGANLSRSPATTSLGDRDGGNKGGVKKINAGELSESWPRFLTNHVRITSMSNLNPPGCLSASRLYSQTCFLTDGNPSYPSFSAH